MKKLAAYVILAIKVLNIEIGENESAKYWLDVLNSLINRGFQEYLEEQKAGHDPRFTIVAALEDPDMIDSQKERIRIDNVWFDELEIMKFAKGEVVETEIPFKFTPEDLAYMETVE